MMSKRSGSSQIMAFKIASSYDASKRRNPRYAEKTDKLEHSERTGLPQTERAGFEVNTTGHCNHDFLKSLHTLIGEESTTSEQQSQKISKWFSNEAKSSKKKPITKGLFSTQPARSEEGLVWRSAKNLLGERLKGHQVDQWITEESKMFVEEQNQKPLNNLDPGVQNAEKQPTVGKVSSQVKKVILKAGYSNPSKTSYPSSGTGIEGPRPGDSSRNETARDRTNRSIEPFQNLIDSLLPEENQSTKHSVASVPPTSMVTPNSASANKFANHQIYKFIHHISKDAMSFVPPQNSQEDKAKELYENSVLKGQTTQLDYDTFSKMKSQYLKSFFRKNQDKFEKERKQMERFLKQPDVYEFINMNHRDEATIEEKAVNNCQYDVMHHRYEKIRKEFENFNRRERVVLSSLILDRRYKQSNIVESHFKAQDRRGFKGKAQNEVCEPQKNGRLVLISSSTSWSKLILLG